MASHTDLLPPELKAGWVYNRVLRSVGDTVNDEDQFPDGVPAEGEVVFEPDVSTVQVNTDGVGTTVVKDRITCKIHQGVNQPGDPDRTKAGLLIDPAGSVGGVYLSEGGWTATYQLLGASVPPVQFVLTEEHTKDNPLDIAMVAGITPSPMVKFVVNEHVYHDTLAARDEVRGILSSVQSDQDEIRDLLESVQFDHIDEVYVGSDTPPATVSLWVDTTGGGKRVKSLVDGQWVEADAGTLGEQGSSDFMRYLPDSPVGSPIQGFDANTVDRTKPSMIPLYAGVNVPSQAIGILETIPYASHHVAQYFHEISGATMGLYRRSYKDGTVWSAWEKQSVDSQITYHGTASNGAIRFSNGVQIAWLETTVDIAIPIEYGSAFMNNRAWTFAVAFSSTPAVSCGRFQYGSSSSWGTVVYEASRDESKSVLLRILDFLKRPDPAPTKISAIAIGRWK